MMQLPTDIRLTKHLVDQFIDRFPGLSKKVSGNIEGYLRHIIEEEAVLVHSPRILNRHGRLVCEYGLQYQKMFFPVATEVKPDGSLEEFSVVPTVIRK